MFDYDRQRVLDSVVNVVPLGIIVVLTGLFVVYNPWGWQDHFLISIVFGLHLVPLLTLAPVTYLAVRVVDEAADGESGTADRIRNWFQES